MTYPGFSCWRTRPAGGVGASADKKTGINLCTSPKGLFEATRRCKCVPDDPDPELPARPAKTRTRRAAFPRRSGQEKPNTRSCLNIGTRLTACNPSIRVSRWVGASGHCPKSRATLAERSAFSPQRGSTIPAQGKARRSAAQAEPPPWVEAEKWINPLPCAPSAWEGGRGEGFRPPSRAVAGCALAFVAPHLACGQARRGSMSLRTCDRGATEPRAKWGATRRAAGLFGAGGVARSSQTRGGYARRSRLACAKNPSPRTSTYLCS